MMICSATGGNPSALPCRRTLERKEASNSTHHSALLIDCQSAGDMVVTLCAFIRSRALLLPPSLPPLPLPLPLHLPFPPPLLPLPPELLVPPLPLLFPLSLPHLVEAFPAGEIILEGLGVFVHPQLGDDPVTVRDRPAGKRRHGADECVKARSVIPPELVEDAPERLAIDVTEVSAGSLWARGGGDDGVGGGA